MSVMIIGGGVVGFSSAIALAQQNIPVTLIEAKPLPTSLPNYNEFDNRVSALTPASIDFLKSIQVWDDIIQMRASSFTQMRVWEQGTEAQIYFDALEYGQDNLGAIVEQNVLMAALIKRAKQFSCLSIQQESICQQITFDQKAAYLTLQDGRQLQAQLIIGADGAQSWVRQHFFPELWEWSYQQQAIIGTVKTEYPHQETAWQCFLPTGPLAFLPLSDQHYCSIVWSCDASVIKNNMALSPSDFNRALSKAFDNQLGNVQMISQPVSIPLTMRQCKTYAKPRLALLGDAAHTFHPLAGQGVNMGLQDVICLTQIISQAIVQKKDPGMLHRLRPYARERQAHNWQVIGLMEGFKRLFGTAYPSIKTLRSYGLESVNHIHWLKRQFIRYASGSVNT